MTAYPFFPLFFYNIEKQTCNNSNDMTGGRTHEHYLSRIIQNISSI